MSATTDILVLKDGRRIGPFDVDQLLELVDEGEVSYNDVCMRRGESRTMRVRHVLDWDDQSQAPQAAEDAEQKEIFYPNPMPMQQSGFGQSDEDEGEEGHVEVKQGQVVYRGYPSIMNYPRSIGISAIVTIVGIIMWETNGLILFGGLCLAMLTYIRVAYERATRVYLVTPERIETIFGFVTKSSNEVRVRDIRAINVRTQGLKGWLGVGDVEFASAGGQDVEVLFRGVWKPHQLKQLVRAVQDNA